MKRRKRVVPDFLRRALRQAIGVGGAVCLGYLIMDPLGGWDSRVATQWLQGCKWAGITIVVVSAPVIGKVAQYSLERTLGTIAGGLLGYTVVVFGHSITELDDVWFTTCTTAVVAFSAAVGGHAIGLDYSFKLFVLTFLLVIMGAERSTDAFLVMLTRVAGIVLGVFLSLLLSVLIFPKSASHEATDSVYYSLAKLADLNRIAWNIEWDKDDDDDKGAGYVYSSGMTRKASTGFVVIDGLDRVTDRPHSTERDRKEADCEQVLMDVYSKLSKCQEFLAVSKSETYLLTLRGRWCFLPGIPWVEIGRWKLPQQELSILATSIRKVARVLWALHVTFQEGFEDEVMQLLRKRYPPDMMPELQLFSQGALDDLKDAFPEAAMVKTTNLHRFLKAVQELIRHSDQQRRAVVRYMQEVSRPGSTTSSPGPSRRVTEDGWTTPITVPKRPFLESLTPSVSQSNLQQPGGAATPTFGSHPNLQQPARSAAASQHGQHGQRTQQEGQDAIPGGQNGHHEGPHEMDGLARPPLEVGGGSQQGAESSSIHHPHSSRAGDSSRAPLSSIQEGWLPNPPSGAFHAAHAGLFGSDAGLNRTGEDGPSSRASEGGSRHDESAPTAARSSSKAGRAGKAGWAGQTELSQPLLGPHDEDDTDSNPSPAQQRQPPQNQIRSADPGADQTRSAVPEADSPYNTATMSPLERPLHPLGRDGSALFPPALQPEGLTADLQPEGLPPVADAKLDLFPQTSAGYISKVRWYSFQFLMQQLADELNDAYVAMSNVLARLPK